MLPVPLVVPVSPSFAQPIYAENQIPARGVEIDYTLDFKNPSSHLYDVEISIKGIRDTVAFGFDAGLVSRHVSHRELCTQRAGLPRLDQRATRRSSGSRPTNRPGGSTKQAADDVTVRYQVFSTPLNDQMADVAPPATFMYVVGQKHVPCSVKYQRPGRLEGVYGARKERRPVLRQRLRHFHRCSSLHRRIQSSRIRNRRRASPSGLQQTEHFDERTAGDFRRSGHRRGSDRRSSASFPTRNTRSCSKFSRRPRIASST